MTLSLLWTLALTLTLTLAPSMLNNGSLLSSLTSALCSEDLWRNSQHAILRSEGDSYEAVS